MKILQINSTANKGSTGRIAEQIGTLIQNEGWESIIAFGRDANSSSSMLYRIGNDIDIKLHGLKSYLLGKHGLGSAKATFDLLDFIKQEKVDIVHLHNIHGYYINYEVLFKYLKTFDGKVIWTFHDCWSFTGHCSHFSDINCNKWQTECKSCPKVKNYPKSLFLDTSKETFQLKNKLFNGVENLQIVAVSDWLKGLVEKSFLKNYPVSTITNGVNLELFKPEAKNSKLVELFNLNNKFVMLTASTSWARQKGFDDYMKLSKFLKEDEVIIMIGLKKEVIETLPPNIIGITRTENQKELADWYNTADVVLNLSLQETFGMTSAEGFACGKPTIVYNATASPELVTSEKLGYIIEPGDVEKVNLAKEKIRNYGNLFYKEYCRNTAEEKYDMQKQFQKYIHLYEN